MDSAQIFKEFVENLTINNNESIINRFSSITKRLNTDFHELDSNTENGTYIGSYGRNTAIDGISDLDIIFVLPDGMYAEYNNRSGNCQKELLQDVADSIYKTYSTSKVRGDGQVVVVEFQNDYIEVCPAFLENDGSYTYPDSNNGGSWKRTNPVPEAEAIENLNEDANNDNIINLCRIVRAWKNKCGIVINGLLIDTFVFNFFIENNEYQSIEYDDYPNLVKDFFAYLKEINTDRKYWYAPGSNQKVYKKNSNFKAKASKALKNIEDAIAKDDNSTVYEVWRKVFGKYFPYPKEVKERSQNYSATEEYIEQRYPLNIHHFLRIDCQVTQDGDRVALLRDMLRLKKNKKLKFFIDKTDTPEPFDVFWKVKNEGEFARDRWSVRGQLIKSNSSDNVRNETSSFDGAHFVECYIIKDGFCVARDRIEVPISDF
ncbi:nucleotidyltransferase [Pedobacter sp. LMG 31464]|uniref:Nucleotidyltransferase n=1 Tax=Pedobacter planticolens TaxID=2679964 RepID=A0A923E0G6_9SPHI|nr:nucleotidyltransferase [Pedobacter planticolens]MBB2145299.1 nucleotidyltransferase [Pedobacter planticolens]